MKTKYVICSRFNADFEVSARCHVPSLTREWIINRIGIFQRFTRKSLEAQTCQEFLSIIMVHPTSMEIVQEELRKYPPLPSNIVFTDKKNDVIEAYIQKGERLVLINLDSDDLYHPNFMHMLQSYPIQEETEALIFTHGYIYNAINGILDEYEYVSPPFYAQVFNVDAYLSYLRYYKGIRHYYIQDFKYEKIEERVFMIILHHENSFKHYKKIVPDLFGTVQKLEDYKEILQDYHIESNTKG